MKIVTIASTVIRFIGLALFLQSVVAEAEISYQGTLRFASPGLDSAALDSVSQLGFLSIEIDDDVIDFELREKQDLLAADYRAVVSEIDVEGRKVSQSAALPTHLRFYYGIVGRDSFVALAELEPGRLTGVLKTSAGFFEVTASRDRQENTVLAELMDDKAIAELLERCETLSRSEHQHGDLDSNIISFEDGSTANGNPISDRSGVPLKVIQMATEFDQTVLSGQYGTVANANAAILATMNTVDTWLRALIHTKIVVVYQHGYTAGAPYLRAPAPSCSPTSIDPDCCNPTEGPCLISRFFQHWNANEYPSHPTTLAHYFTRNLRTSIGVATLGSLSCPSYGELLGVGITVPGSPSDTAVTAAHEIGHNLGAVHDDPCNGPWLMCANGGPAQFSPRSLSAILPGLANRSCLDTEGVGSPPSLSLEPQGQIVLPGSTLTLTVQVNSSSPVGYSWMKDGVAIPGAYGSSLTITNFVPGNVGVYQANISNPWGRLLTHGAALAISPLGAPPVITTQPQSVTAPQGSAFSVNVQASGSGSLRYQWWKNGTPVANQISSSYSIPSFSEGDVGTYQVRVTNNYGAVFSQIATLAISAACRADYDRVGGVTIQDLFDFLADWVDGTQPNSTNRRADFNQSGDVSLQDLFDFLAAYFEGC